jgi:hypothetical protein
MTYVFIQLFFAEYSSAQCFLIIRTKMKKLGLLLSVTEKFEGQLEWAKLGKRVDSRQEKATEGENS